MVQYPKNIELDHGVSDDVNIKAREAASDGGKGTLRFGKSDAASLDSVANIAMLFYFILFAHKAMPSHVETSSFVHDILLNRLNKMLHWCHIG